MQRTNGAGHVAHMFVDEDVATSRPPTELTPAWFNAVQEELVNLATMTGFALDDAHNDQAKNALVMAMQQSTFSVAVAGGTVNAITAAFTSPILLGYLMNGMPLRVRALGANTVAAPTFTPNEGVVPAKPIVKGNNLALVAGDILGDKYWMTLVYDADLDKWVLQNPAKGITSLGYMLVRDEKESGVGGGNSSTGINTRVLNTVIANTISGASFNPTTFQITLPDGTYRFKGSCPAAICDGHKASIYNITDATYEVIGTSENGATPSLGDVLQTRSLITGKRIFNTTKVLQINHWFIAGATGGLGAATSSGIGNEVYSELEIFKEE